jgi:hypothetical protein
LIKTSLIIVFFLLINLSNYSQLPEWSWAKNAISDQNCDGFCVSPVTNNTIYVAGEFFGDKLTFGNIMLTNSGKKGTNDIFIVQYDLDGNVIMAKSFGGEGNDFARSIAVDNSGNIFIAGGFTSSSIKFDYITLNNSELGGANDIYITKLTSAGNVLWAKKFSGKYDDKANSICCDHLGNAYITGWFCSEKLSYEKDTIKNISGGGLSDIFLCKFDPDGNIEWVHTAKGNGNDYAYGITADNNNDIYITGGSSSPDLTFNGITISNLGFEKIFIAKYSTAGDLIWAQSVGGSSNEEGTSITTDINNNVYITGKFQSSSITMDTTTLINAGTFDIFIAKYSPGGNVLWAKSAGGNSDERGNSIISDKQGNVYITGWFASPKILFGKTVLLNPGSKGTTHCFIAKYNSEGEPIWSECANGKMDDWGNGIVLDENENLYITGGFDGTSLNFNNNKLTNGDANILFTAKLGFK